jgi:very-short-patch-repair endonuclease
MIKGTGKSYRRARELRRTMSLPEVLLWQHLRKQHPAGPYNLDFYCDAAKLCVEVDGEAHDRGNRPQRHLRRDAWLVDQGITTLRIPAAEVLRNIEGVLLHIAETARRLANSSPDGGGRRPKA